MTTYTTEPKRRRWWSYLGPWPLYPVAVGGMMSIIAFVSQIYRFTPVNALPAGANAVLFGIFLGGLMWLANRFLPRVVANLWGYLAVLVIITALGGIVRLLQGSLLEYSTLPAIGQFSLYFWRAMPLVIGIQILMGVSQDRLQRQVIATQEALRAVELQSAALLKADEEIRRSVATVLHDRVQAGLLAACLRLQLTRDTRPADLDVNLDRVIDELEELRSIDVRRAVRALSPNLQDLDLQTSLDDLTDAFRPAVDVRVMVAGNCNPDPQARLAIYRIAEQALMNAVSHGEASTVHIEVDRVDGHAVVTITDDGHGVREGASAGFGTTVIDTWCRTLRGTWTRAARPEGGTIVIARIPQRRATDERGMARQP